MLMLFCFIIMILMMSIILFAIGGPMFFIIGDMIIFGYLAYKFISEKFF